MNPWGSSLGPGAFCQETPPAQASLASPVDAEPHVESWVLRPMGLPVWKLVLELELQCTHDMS